MMMMMMMMMMMKKKKKKNKLIRNKKQNKNTQHKTKQYEIKQKNKEILMGNYLIVIKAHRKLLKFIFEITSTFSKSSPISLYTTCNCNYTLYA